MANRHSRSLYQFLSKKVKETVIAAVYSQTEYSKQKKQESTQLLGNQELKNENTKLKNELEAAKVQNALITETGQRIINQREITILNQTKQITNLETENTDKLKHIEVLELDLKVIKESNHKQVQKLTELLDDRVAEAAVNQMKNRIQRKDHDKRNDIIISTDQQMRVGRDHELIDENIKLNNEIQHLSEELADARAKILIQNGNRIGKLYHAYISQTTKLEDVQKLLDQYEATLPTIKMLLGKAFHGCLQDIVKSNSWLTDIVKIVDDNGIENLRSSMDVELLRKQNKKLNDQLRKIYYAYLPKKKETEALKFRILNMEGSNKRQQPNISEQTASTMPREKTMKSLKRRQSTERVGEPEKMAKTDAHNLHYNEVDNKLYNGRTGNRKESRQDQKVFVKEEVFDCETVELTLY